MAALLARSPATSSSRTLRLPDAVHRNEFSLQVLQEHANLDIGATLHIKTVLAGVCERPAQLGVNAAHQHRGGNSSELQAQRTARPT